MYESSMTSSIDISAARKKIPLQSRATLALQQATQPGRGAFISAASGLVRHGDYFFVVADDELQLGIFSATTLQPGTAWPLLPGNLPLEPQARKRAKPDFEVLVLLPPAPAHPHGALLILGSGSTPQRRRGVVVALSAQGLPQRDRIALVDLTPLYTALEREFGVVNIEGGVVQSRTAQRQQLLLLQRGNNKNGNAIVQLDLAELYREIGAAESSSTTHLLHDIAQLTLGANSLRAIDNYELGSLAGVALGFTDATCLPNQELLALAVAEDTDNAYADGATLGSYLCRFDRDNRLQSITPMAAPAKTEGLTVWHAGSCSANTQLAFVTDADDPAAPALLLTAYLHAFE